MNVSVGPVTPLPLRYLMDDSFVSEKRFANRHCAQIASSLSRTFVLLLFSVSFCFRSDFILFSSSAEAATVARCYRTKTQSKS